MGKVIGDLSSRGGKILGMDTDGNFQVVRAQVARGVPAFAALKKPLSAKSGELKTK